MALMAIGVLSVRSGASRHILLEVLHRPLFFVPQPYNCFIGRSNGCTDLAVNEFFETAFSEQTVAASGHSLAFFGEAQQSPIWCQQTALCSIEI